MHSMLWSHVKRENLAVSTVVFRAVLEPLHLQQSSRGERAVVEWTGPGLWAVEADV